MKFLSVMFLSWLFYFHFYTFCYILCTKFVQIYLFLDFFLRNSIPFYFYVICTIMFLFGESWSHFGTLLFSWFVLRILKHCVDAERVEAKTFAVADSRSAGASSDRVSYPRGPSSQPVRLWLVREDCWECRWVQCFIRPCLTQPVSSRPSQWYLSCI